MDIRTILVDGIPYYRAFYVHRLRLIELDVSYLLDTRATPEAIACLLTHEAQHARLYRLGFGYGEPMRARIEMLCFRAERNVARILPNGEAEAAAAQYWLDAGPERLDSMFSNEGRRQAYLKALKDLGCPAWLLRAVGWASGRIHSRRSARTRSGRLP